MIQRVFITRASTKGDRGGTVGRGSIDSDNLQARAEETEKTSETRNERKEKKSEKKNEPFTANSPRLGVLEARVNRDRGAGGGDRGQRCAQISNVIVTRGK